MRPFGEGKVAHHTNAYNQQYSDGRYDRHWLKDKALTRGGLGIDSVSMRQVVSRTIVGEDTTAVTVLTDRIDLQLAREQVGGYSDIRSCTPKGER